jgi:opacity protein-like surface antigen
MKKIFLSFFVLLLSLGIKAQTHEIGPFLGTSYYMGDLVQSQFFSTPGYNLGVNYRYNMNSRFAIKLAVHYGQITGDSKNNKKSLQYKNLSFHSSLLDFEGGLEINFLEYMPGSTKHRFTPYIFGGLAIFRFNPKAYYQGNEYELQGLGTEGQGLTAYPDKQPYKLTSFAIPFGFGFKFNVSKRVSLGLEWGMRKTFTDYLDDVSTRYPDPALLYAEKGAVAAALSNRVYEQQAIEAGLNIAIGPNGIPENQTDFNTYMEMQKTYAGGQRGAEDKDWYGIAGITIMFKIVGAKKGSCPAYQKHNYFREYIR